MGMTIGAAQTAYSPAARASGAAQTAYSPAANAPGTAQESGLLSRLRAEQIARQQQAVPESVKAQENAKKGDCQTCKSRKYQDESGDPGVSFKTPQGVDPRSATSAIAGHEQEHVTREQASAQAEGREILYQNVRLFGGICPECGKNYTAGGVTQTVSRPASAALFRVGLPEENTSPFRAQA